MDIRTSRTWKNLSSRHSTYCIWRGYCTPKFDRWSRASRHIRGGTRTNRLVSRFMRSPPCGPSPAVRVKTPRMFYARSRNARFALMYERCHVVRFCSVPQSALARNFRLTSTSMTFRDIRSGADLRIDSLRGKTSVLFIR